jgi:serine/threonine protein kinase
MTHCLDQSQLQQLLAEDVPAATQSEWDQHLSNCATCRENLESITDVAGISRIMGDFRTKPKQDSQHLKQAIDRLHSEATYFHSAHSTLNARSDFTATIPQLQPSMKQGFMGRLGDIQIKRVLGQGGMGVVFEGLDAVLNRTVAVKVLSPHLLNHPDAKDRFVREAQAAAALLHENVVAIHGIHEAEGMPYLVLQYVQGESLADKLLREKKLAFDQVIKLGKQVARGLAAAHDRGLVHRDIKPGNILFDAETGDVRIADFGLAKHVGTDTLTAEGVLTGTPAYMSPEQASDKAIDARSDLFSLGVVLYQASTGQLPFTADSPFVLLDHIRTTTEKPIQQLNPELPNWFCDLVHRLLKKEPENRIPSALEVVRIFDEQGGIKPLPAQSSTSGWSPVVLASLLVLGGLAAVWLMQLRNDVMPVTSQAAATMGFSVNGSSTLLNNLAEAIEATPDGGIIEVHGDGPFSCNTIKIDSKRLTIRSALGSHPRMIPEVTGTSGFRQFIATSADLQLEGLEIYWPLVPPSLKSDEPLTRSVVSINNGKLTILNCRIIAGPGTACLASESQQVLVERSHLSATNGVGIGWRLGAEPITIRNCMLDTRFATIVARHVGDEETVVHNPLIISQSNIKSFRLMHYLFDARAKSVLDVQMTKNIIDCNAIVALISVPKPLTPLNNHQAMIASLAPMMTWKDEGNIYRKRMIYLASTRANNFANLLFSDFKQLSQWLEYWKMPANNSIEASLSYPETTETAPGKFSLMPAAIIEGSSGPVNAGAHVKYVGPGAAYAAWRKEHKQ